MTELILTNKVSKKANGMAHILTTYLNNKGFTGTLMVTKTKAQTADFKGLTWYDFVYNDQDYKKDFRLGYVPSSKVSYNFILEQGWNNGSSKYNQLADVQTSLED